MGGGARCYHRPGEATGLLLTVFLIGAIGGLLSGMLGVGGAVLLLPLLTLFAGLDIKAAAGLTIVQVVASSSISWAVYRRGSLVHGPLALVMGLSGAVGGLVAGYGSAGLSGRALEWVFFGVVVVAIALLLLPIPEAPPESGGALPPFNPLLAAGLGLLVGGLAGLLGSGGGFLIVPLLIGVMRLPVRLAIGTSPAVVLLSGAAGLAGKLISGQVDPLLAGALVAGAAPSAYLGTRLGRRMPPQALRLLLGTLLVLIAARTLYSILIA